MPKVAALIAALHANTHYQRKRSRGKKKKQLLFRNDFGLAREGHWHPIRCGPNTLWAGNRSHLARKRMDRRHRFARETIGPRQYFMASKDHLAT
ncbi:hypothetical protein CEXT_541231 [Caerostris extrusa]|uniref:Uncharacterized protein n=1 Tax=Caerostris extrusa TaxID=172846 RepID=A0AAV4SKZ1_CAEEX|nr:hypothetical protein CEXT_541231 [Caerostris extrusa]